PWRHLADELLDLPVDRLPAVLEADDEHPRRFGEQGACLLIQSPYSRGVEEVKANRPGPRLVEGVEESVQGVALTSEGEQGLLLRQGSKLERHLGQDAERTKGADHQL